LRWSHITVVKIRGKGMKRVVIWGWHWPADIAAIQRLEAQKKIEVVMWVGRDSVCTHNLNELLHQFKLPTSSYSGAGNAVYAEVFQHYPEFLDLYSRVGFSAGRTHQELLCIFNCYFDAWSDVLCRKKVDMVFINNIPHFGIDYLLYCVAKALKITVIMPYQSLVPERFFAVRDLDDFGWFNGTREDENVPHQSIDSDRNQDLINRVTWTTKPPTKANTRNSAVSLIGDLYQLCFRKRSKPMSLSGIVQKFESSLSYNKYISNLAKTEVDLSKQFVYFPLHMQPELTTSALGGRYSDQLLALEHLSSFIPDDWYIYAKENPKQTRRQREELFYTRLQRIPKVVYISPVVDTHILTAHARFVASINGTVGWEAIQYGKPALVFGKAWYRSLPGVFEYSEALKLSDLLECTIDKTDLEKSYNYLMRKTYRGVSDPVYSVLVNDYTIENNSKLIEEFFLNMLEC